MTCNCNLYKGRKVDLRTKESYMKERELPIRKSFNIVVEEGVDQINASDDSMDIDIGSVDNENDDSSSEQELREFNFLVMKPKKTPLNNHGGRSRIDYSLDIIEQYYSDED